jgi:hypothetical protein
VILAGPRWRYSSLWRGSGWTGTAPYASSAVSPGRAGISKQVSPQTPRHAFITADAGVPLRDVREAASHADPRTTMRCDRARTSLDRHATYIVATYIVATYIAGATR